MSRRSTALVLAMAAMATACTFRPLPASSPSGLSSLATSPVNLNPTFAPDQHDYSVPCQTGVNEIAISAIPVAGSTVEVVGGDADGMVALVENELARITVTNDGQSSEDYWIRCLPHDFPVFDIERPGTVTPGWYVLAPSDVSSGGSNYVVILDDHGAPVWYHASTVPILDAKLLPNGNLGWMIFTGGSYGTDPTTSFEEHRLDGSLVRTWSTVGTPTDFHEALPTPEGNMLMLSYHLRTDVDVSELAPEYSGTWTVADNWLQEIRPDGTVAWEWRSEEHLQPGDTTAQLDGMQLHAGDVLDLVHGNSIDLDPAGDVIFSSRHHDAIYKIRRDPGQPDDGRIIWKLGGTTPSDPNTRHLTIVNDDLNGPRRQHDARWISPGHLTAFDNRTNRTGEVARAVDYLIDEQAGTATLVWSYRHSSTSCCLGSARRQPDGATVMSFGPTSPILIEAAASGAPLLQVNLSTFNYRVTKEAIGRLDRDVLRAAVAP